MSTPFARIQTRYEPAAGSDMPENKMGLIATLSIEANSDRTIDAYLGGLQIYNDLFEWRLSEYPQKALDLIIDCFLPAESVPHSILAEGVSAGIIRSRLFQSGDWISAKQWIHLALSSNPGVEIDPDELLANGKIFSLRPGKVDFFPTYGLDGSNGYQPIHGLCHVLSVLSARMNDWSIAAWFQSENPYLGGVAPKALLASAQDKVLAAAKVKPRRNRVSR